MLSGIAGTNTITATGPATYSYDATRPAVWFIPANTNTGATTVNVTPSGASALGAKNVFWDGAACVGGELKQNVPVALIYDGTQFNIVAHGTIGAATQAQQEAGTATTFAVTPARQHFHPSSPKVWGYVTFSGGATPTLQQSYNVTSITDTAIGRTTITIATDFALATYASIVSAEFATSDSRFTFVEPSKTAGAFVVSSHNATPTDTDVDFNFACFGDQA